MTETKFDHDRSDVHQLAILYSAESVSRIALRRGLERSITSTASLSTSTKGTPEQAALPPLGRQSGLRYANRPAGRPGG